MLLLVILISILANCDTHMILCNNQKCEQCLFMYNIQNILQNIYILKQLGLILILLNIVRYTNDLFKNNTSINLISLKVRLNE